MQPAEAIRPMRLDCCPEVETLGVGRMPVPGITTWFTRDNWALHLYCYEATLSVNGVAVLLRPGMIGLTPPRTALVWVGPETPSEHLYCLFRVPELTARDLTDAVLSGGAQARSRRGRPGRPGVMAGAEAFAFPYAFDVGPAFAPMWADALVAMHAIPRSRRRAEVRLWDLLWTFRDLVVARDRTPLRPALKEACRLIDMELHTSLRVAILASRLGVSHNHLTRMFQEGFGQTVVGYIRRRRVERARSLLEHTDFPVGTIAGMVGIPDLHLFNKTMRRETGHAPTALRGRRRE